MTVMELHVANLYESSLEFVFSILMVYYCSDCWVAHTSVVANVVVGSLQQRERDSYFD